MIGPMCGLDIQNLLEAFASIKREKSLRSPCKVTRSIVRC